MIINLHELKFNNWHINKTLIKDTDQYEIYDNTTLNNLTVSETKLRAGKSTNGHRHKSQEEVYIFTEGSGEMELDYNVFSVTRGDIVLVPDNVFHKVHNDTDYWLKFVCIFEGKRC
tara:strand:+ start:18426 stop:18773 length:348 start_codon:yes stop_codon:yes gene_type:complete